MCNLTVLLLLFVQHILVQEVNQVTWHPAGDYFATVSYEAQSEAILLHQMSKGTTQVSQVWIFLSKFLKQANNFRQEK